MLAFKKFARTALILVLVYFAGWVFVKGYPYIFAKTIEGKIEKIERVDLNVALMQNPGVAGQINPDLFSFAVAIIDKNGQIWTASANDRQWASIAEGRCVKAKFFPYPPWDLSKADTYHGARLLEARECP